MEHPYSKNNFVCIILAFIFILQSCSVYKKKPVTLNEASNVNRCVQITRMNGTKISLRKVEKIDSTYYGYNKIKGELVKVPLDEKDIKKIRVKDRTGTTLVNVGIVSIALAIIIGITAASAIDSMDFGGQSPGN